MGDTCKDSSVEIGGLSFGAPSVANFKANVKDAAGFLNEKLSLDERAPGGPVRLAEARSAVAAARERKDEIVGTGIAHSRALAADVNDEGEKFWNEANAFVRREPLWTMAGLGGLTTVLSLRRRGLAGAFGRGIFVCAAGIGFLAYTAVNDDDEEGLPRD